MQTLCKSPLYGFNLSDKADMMWWPYTGCIFQQRPNVCFEC